MLIKFGAKNFFCFKEWVELSFESPNKNEEASNVLCVKGANASGKTNALKILSFLSDFCTDSFAKKPEEEIHFQNFFSNSEPSEFFIDFVIDKVFYRYELSATNAKVISERIYRRKSRLTPVIKRDDKISEAKAEFAELKPIKIRTNASLVSTAHQYEIDCIEPIYTFFKYIMTNVLYLGQNESKPNLSALSSFYDKYTDDFQFAKKLISQFDLGINDIEISTVDGEDGEKTFFPVFFHNIDGEKKKLLFHFESSGTKALYNQLYKYKAALNIGGILVMDEFDINLHPDILPKLVELFLDKDINKNNAQLVFTTHHTDIMDTLGKYRTVLVKKQENESFAYRLDEISGSLLRNDRPISPVYKAGKIGGVPCFG